MIENYYNGEVDYLYISTDSGFFNDLTLEKKTYFEFTFGYDEKGKEYIKKITHFNADGDVVLSALGVKSFSLKENSDFKFVEGSATDYENRIPDGYEGIWNYDYENFMGNQAEAHIKINVLTEEKLIDLEIENIKKDRTGEIEFKIK